MREPLEQRFKIAIWQGGTGRRSAAWQGTVADGIPPPNPSSSRRDIDSFNSAGRWFATYRCGKLARLFAEDPERQQSIVPNPMFQSNSYDCQETTLAVNRTFCATFFVMRVTFKAG